ncbi:MAG: MFS transporter [Ktedonobacteraceae bacterium]
MASTQDDTTRVEQVKKVSIWRNRDYTLLWGGQAISTIGSSVSELAFPLLVLAVTHSPAQAGLVAALDALPASLFSLPAGVLVDRWDRKLVMLLCQVGRFLSLASIPLAFALGHLSIYQLYINAFVEGTLAMLFRLAHAASLGQVVARDQLSSAIMQEELMEGTTALCGPSLSGLLFTLGQMLPFVTDAISYAVSIVSLLLIRTPFQGERKTERPHLLAEIREGIVWMWQQPLIRAMTVFMVPAAFFIPGSTLAIIVLAQQRGASPVVIGAIFALGGVGSIVGSLLAPFWEKRLSVGQAILLCRWIFAFLWPLYILIPVPLFMSLVDFGIGFADPIEDVPYFSYRLQLIPEALRGRVISACRLFPSLVRPLGLVVTGLLLQSIGPVPVLLIGWCGLLLLALLMTGNRHIREARK